MMLLEAASSASSGPSLSWLEAGMTMIATGLAFLLPRLGSGFFRQIERAFLPLARNQGLAVAVTGFIGLALRLAILPMMPVPKPFLPDDFSFLLSADTFAHGRLVNPTPALWVHFETMHESMTPTYASMYFPGQGLLLAAGQVLTGTPWFALLAATALMSAAICWMLQAWLPPGWALLGGLLSVLHLGLFSYWINTYTGAAQLAAIGGALVLGAYPRIVRHARYRDCVFLGLGAVLLAYTRPYEGVLLCLPILAALGFWAVRRNNPQRPPWPGLLRRAAIPVLLVGAAAAWLAYYDAKAFGNPLTLPYSVNRAQYAVAPYYVWQQPRPDPGYRHKVLRDFYYDNEMPMYRLLHNPATFVPFTAVKFGLCLLFFTGFALLPPLAMARRVALDRRTRMLAIGVLVLAAGMVIEIYMIPHYLAPFTSAFYALGLQATRHLRLWSWDGKPVGLGWVRMLIAVCVLMGGVRLFAAPLHLEAISLSNGGWNFNWYGPPPTFGDERSRIESHLEQLPGRHLAIVRYSARHELLNEWVYNSADMENAKVLWAREMSSPENKELIGYYKDRTVWLVEPDEHPAVIRPYAAP
jgi:hypothetical protein